MWTALWIACAWWLARIVPALLYRTGMSMKQLSGAFRLSETSEAARQTHLAYIDATFSAW